MEAPEEVAMGSKDHSNIVKGKRTKRFRTISPIPFAITSNNSIDNGDGGEFEGIPIVENKNYAQYFSPSSSSTSEYHDSTEEEEDMANCLILLAQGQSRDSVKLQADYHHHHDTAIYNKFTSRRFMEASNGTGKAGYYVYECKTCNRTFPSFQALGGHRASHKKPKAASAAAMVDAKIRQFTTAAATDEEEGQFIKTNNLSSLSLQLSNNNNNNNNNNRGLYSNNNKAKVHECSICGAEFTSGQALGGHMRRHRGPIIGSNIGTSTASTALALAVPMATESMEPKKPRNVLSLDLDLNLPAPEDDHRESKFLFASKQQQQQQPQQQQQQQSPLVFPAPTLVDCHY
ncbi:hypothetical protein DITRI_Ditri12bG0094900 [Diplodiscus trichospermus]